MNKKLKKVLAAALLTVLLSANAFAIRPIFHRPTVGTIEAPRHDLENQSTLSTLASTPDDGDRPVRNETANGLNTTTFDTLVGTVTVNLPDDLAAGDSISGTVMAELKREPGTAGNQAPKEQTSGMDELSGYVIEVAEQQTPIKEPEGNLIDFCKGPIESNSNNKIGLCKAWTVPEKAAYIPVVLKNKAGTVVGRSRIPVAPKAPFPVKEQDGKISTPQIGQAGKPVSIKGQMGNFEDTAIKMGKQTARFLASSPRKMVVESPRDLKGINDIEIEYKGRTVARCTYRSISVRLAADKLNLTKGEQTNMTVTLAGLIGLLSPVSLQLTNKSPGTVSMAGGEAQTINVSPSEVNGDSFVANKTLTGVKPGGFSINAFVDPAKSVSDCTPAIAGDLPRTPSPQPSPGEPNGPPTPRPPDTPGTPQPLRGRFRVTFNGFHVNHVTNHGLLQRPDAVTMRPQVETVDLTRRGTIMIRGGSTGVIGMVPGSANRGGSSLPNGGFLTGDSYPTDNPWLRTAPITPFAPGTIPPTIYFENELVQNESAALIIADMWSVDGRSDLGLQDDYIREIIRSGDDVRQAVRNMIRNPPPLELSKYLRPGDAMGIRNTLSLAIGVPQNRPIGMQPMGRQFGFIPQVLVLTYDFADLLSRTETNLGLGIIPIRYVDAPSFGGDYTLFLQVERLDTRPACAEDLMGARFTGTAELTTTRREAAGPFPSPVELTVDFVECRGVVRITNFPPLTSNSLTGLGPNTSTMTLLNGGTGTLASSSRRIEMPVTLALQNSLRVFGNSTLPLILSGMIDPATGTATLRGTGTFSGGALGTFQGTVVVTGTFSPTP